MRINVAKLPEVIMAQGQPGISGGWGAKKYQQERGKRGQETKSQLINGF